MRLAVRRLQPRRTQWPDKWSRAAGETGHAHQEHLRHLYSYTNTNTFKFYRRNTDGVFFLSKL